MRVKDFVSIRDFSPQQILHLLELTCRVKANPLPYCEALKGKSLAMIFEKPSLRTRVTFEVGIQQLGGFALYLSPADISLGKRETVHDVAKNLERMVNGIMIRTFAHEIVERMAEHASVPVINGLTDFCHPCQAMADYLTMFEVKGHLAGLKVAYVGDGNNVAHSLIFAGAQVGARVWLACPSGYEPKPEVVRWAHYRGLDTGATCSVTNDAKAAVAHADVVYTDVWASMGQEDQKDRRAGLFRPYQVNSQLFDLAKPDAIFMHCLPAHRGDEVTDDVIDCRRSVVFLQAENRLHVEKAIMLELMGGQKDERLRRHEVAEPVQA